MKRLLLLVLLLCATPAYADTLTLHAVSTNIPAVPGCPFCIGLGLPNDYRIEAILTLAPPTGLYWHPNFTPPAGWEVIGMTGTLNGAPLTLAVGDFGDGRS